jgi:hypothetical protein
MLRSIRPKRAAPSPSESPVLGCPPIEQGKLPARQAGAERLAGIAPEAQIP